MSKPDVLGIAGFIFTIIEVAEKVMGLLDEATVRRAKVATMAKLAEQHNVKLTDVIKWEGILEINAYKLDELLGKITEAQKSWGDESSKAYQAMRAIGMTAEDLFEGGNEDRPKSFGEVMKVLYAKLGTVADAEMRKQLSKDITGDYYLHYALMQMSPSDVEKLLGALSEYDNIDPVKLKEMLKRNREDIVEEKTDTIEDNLETAGVGRVTEDKLWKARFPWLADIQLDDDPGGQVRNVDIPPEVLALLEPIYKGSTDNPPLAPGETPIKDGDGGVMIEKADGTRVYYPGPNSKFKAAIEFPEGSDNPNMPHHSVIRKNGRVDHYTKDNDLLTSTWLPNQEGPTPPTSQTGPSPHGTTTPAGKGGPAGPPCQGCSCRDNCQCQCLFDSALLNEMAKDLAEIKLQMSGGTQKIGWEVKVGQDGYTGPLSGLIPTLAQAATMEATAASYTIQPTLHPDLQFVLDSALVETNIHLDAINVNAPDLNTNYTTPEQVRKIVYDVFVEVGYEMSTSTTW